MAASNPTYGKRPWTFYVLATLFTLFVLFLYGPMLSIFILSFQGPSASLVFPLRDPSLTTTWGVPDSDFRAAHPPRSQ